MNTNTRNGSLIFKEILDSKNIAIIGASNNPMKLGFQLVHKFLNTNRKIFPIHPKEKKILGFKVYNSVSNIPETINLAIIIVPPSAVPQVIKECGIKGVKYIIINSEGFGEAGDKGAKLNEEIKHLLKTYNIRAIGPNTMGMVDATHNFSTTFVDMSIIKPGNVSICCQTGILTGALLHYINLTKNIGISKSIDLGNKIDLDHADVLDYYAEDTTTKVIMMYIEGIANGPKFLKSLKNIATKKPVIIVKGGATNTTQNLVKSHTGSVAGSINMFDNIIRQAGAIRVNTFEEMIEVAKGFSFMQPPNGNKFAVITGSGGAAVSTVDAGVRNGLKLAKLSKSTIDELTELIGDKYKSKNPIDIWPAGFKVGIARIFSKTISLLEQDENVDGIIPLLFNVKDFRYNPNGIINTCKNCKKPILCAIQGHDVQKLRNKFEKNNIPTFSFGEKAAFVLSQMWQYRKIQESKNKRI
ncbi:MAG: acetate--CoA ligase family protein [Candidatus Helarchaeota archaeon]